MIENNFHNPLLDDDDEEVFSSQLAEVLADDEEVSTPRPFRLNLPTKPVQEPSAPVTDPVIAEPAPEGDDTTDDGPKFGQKGFRKGVPNPHVGTPRARATDVDAELLAFGAVMGVFTTEAASILRHTKSSNISEGGTLPSLSATNVRLLKLRKLDLVEDARALDGTRVWGVTEKGIATARAFGHLPIEDAVSWKGLRDMSYRTLDHARNVSLIAAKFVSPEGYFRESLRVGPVPLNRLVSEAFIRRVQLPIRESLFEEGKSRRGVNGFGRWRADKLAEVVKEVEAGLIDWPDVMESYPELWTVGQPVDTTTVGSVTLKTLPFIGSHWPDLAIDLSSFRKGARAHSLIIEVELSIKRAFEYEALLKTFAKELDQPFVYGRVVYFTVGKQVENALRKADAKLGLGLFESGKLVVLPITDRDGSPIRLKKKLKD